MTKIKINLLILLINHKNKTYFLNLKNYKYRKPTDKSEFRLFNRRHTNE